MVNIQRLPILTALVNDIAPPSSTVFPISVAYLVKLDVSAFITSLSEVFKLRMTMPVVGDYPKTKKPSEINLKAF